MRTLWLLVLSPALVSAYTWQFTKAPAQCQNVTIAISGAGSPPYSVLIIPFGPTPLPNNIEARRIVSQDFPGNQSTVSFELGYPANSQFVAVVSDSTGFGSGGTSVAAQVLAGNNDASCFNASVNVSPQFTFSIEPPNQIVQCSPTRIWWDPAVVQGATQFVGVIPGGQSFRIPVPTSDQLTTVPDEGIGFNWTASLRSGTTLMVVGGDTRGLGSAGSILNTVSAGPYPVSSCLNDNSPSSTPGSPAGGSYATNASGGQTSGGQNSGGGKSNVGAIVGGVLGGLTLALALALIFIFNRRRKSHVSAKEVPVDLLQETEEANGGRSELPPFYHPEPFMAQDPTVASRSSYDPQGRPISMATSTTDWAMGRPGLDRSSTPDALLAPGVVASGATSASRKSAAATRQLRPVNIIQHDDAGPSGANDTEEGETETIELPPAYTNLRKPASATPSPGITAESTHAPSPST